MTKLIDKFASFTTANKPFSILATIWVVLVWGTSRSVLGGADTIRTLVIVILAGPITLVLLLGRNYVYDYLTEQSEQRYLKKQQSCKDRPPRT